MLDSVITTEITLKIFLLCSAASVLLGIAAAFVMIRNSCSSQSFCITIALLPLAVQMVIMLVNGNLGAGVAVAGAFSLVRFRSVPGSAREIAAIFFAMTLGLATGMGYLGLAALFFFIFAASMLLLSALKFGKGDEAERVLKITIPENSTMKACSLTCSASICLPARLSRSKPPTWGHSMNCSTASYFGRHSRLRRFSTNCAAATEISTFPVRGCQKKRCSDACGLRKTLV